MESLVAASSRSRLLSSPSVDLFNQTKLKGRVSFAFINRSKPKPKLVLCNMSASKEAKLWGGRFEGSVTDAVEMFTESISFDKALYKHDIMGSKAHASMLANQVFFFFSQYNSCF